MQKLLAITLDSYKKLYRDKVFIPAIFVATFLMLIAMAASEFGTIEVYKIMYDIGSSSYLFIGCLTGIFWGTNLISDAKTDGSMELQLCSPITRSQWLFGKFLGLVIVKILLAVILTSLWQILFTALGHGTVDLNAFKFFFSLSLAWLVMDSLTILLAILTSKSVALFSSFSLFLIGIISGPLLQSLSPKSDPMVKTLITNLCSFWNLSYFNLSSYLIENKLISISNLLPRIIYAVSLITFFISLSVICFNNKDLQD